MAWHHSDKVGGDCGGSSALALPGSRSVLHMVNLWESHMSLVKSKRTRSLRLSQTQDEHGEHVKHAAGVSELLSDFNQLTVAPSPPHTQQFTSSMKISIVECPIVTWSFSHHERNKVNYWKSVIKVVYNMLIKKWVFVKWDKLLIKTNNLLVILTTPSGIQILIILVFDQECRNISYS
jgi:hypothetical protein